MFKRVMMTLFVMSVVAIWWTEARAGGCPKIGGTAVCSPATGRSFVQDVSTNTAGLVKVLAFAPVPTSCGNPSVNLPMLGHVFCGPPEPDEGTDTDTSTFTTSTFGGGHGGGGGVSRKLRLLPASKLPLENDNPVPLFRSQNFTNVWAAAVELEPDIVSNDPDETPAGFCPAGQVVITFIPVAACVKTIVCPDPPPDEGGPCVSRTSLCTLDNVPQTASGGKNGANATKFTCVIKAENANESNPFDFD
jgi:hypothetical protein